MDFLSLEQIVNQYIQIDPATGTGWHPVLCKICNDRGHKGKRAAFKFDDNKVAYHCFNCGHSTVYDPEKMQKIPEKMVQVLSSFNVPEDQWKQINLTQLVNQDKTGKPTAESHQVTQIEPMVIPLPSHFYPLAEAAPNDKWADIAKYYLEDDRGIDPNSYPFMLSHKTGDPNLDRWFGRVIVPIYKNSQLIFFTARDLTGKKQKKYLSPSYSKEKVLYGFDQLFRQTDEPLYIVEGWFDAFMVNGVAILGNEVSTPQSIWINKSHREKIYIPDRQGNGWFAAEEALKNGWSVSTPDIGDCKDINDAVKKYGKIYVMKSIQEKKISGNDNLTKTKLGFYCNYDPTHKDRSKKKNRNASKA
jgi:hypothetical protein